MPEVASVLVEEAEPEAPYGAKGVGEPPLVASPAAIASAMRSASGRELNRIPVRPDELAGLSMVQPPREIQPGDAPS
jgi:CO/xanthine dehydrogenase Mo-binding subunit